MVQTCKNVSDFANYLTKLIQLLYVNHDAKANKTISVIFSYWTVGWFQCLAIINKVANIIHHFLSKRIVCIFKADLCDLIKRFQFLCNWLKFSETHFTNILLYRKL